ncbi:dnaJ homolog subfamily C member 24 isoform X2 [Neoarius graeffei]|uniref:dnaJ homolog subfamily C member 24 isoform X2 n=1 Tax=Neoarius graeffei TaxID=443677 RepID=UPI00298BF381|nr:dnaJ homolog subfamily C member 24 isoform X2 [Neoarius graeffei]XP_060784257.1 dnaJ homolog subfamily C member 24 isoform X2 [Neoarius graeffei]XP_060784258.1 dnaJ homolog subfamily C member 24 isoform X2 [Neoarius graeffei]
MSCQTRSMSNARDLEKNWYSILGATSTDDFQELKQKYQRLVLMFHPDKQQPGLSEEEAGLQLQRFIDVDQAWKILSNEESRREFDLQLRAHELKQRWPVDACVTLEDMNWDSENECYSYSCRCGGEFLLEKEDADGDEDAVVCCDTCSLSIEVKRAP